MSTFAYWISKTGEIMKPDSRHIGAIIDKPSKYGETKKTIADTYAKHGEGISSTVEGKAREEIMLRVIRRGYIRIRKGGTRRNQKWSIQVNRLTPKIGDYLWEWAQQMLSSREELDSFADVIIHQLGKNDKMTKTNMKNLASGATIKEGKRIFTQAEANEEWPDYFDIADQYFDEIHESAQQELIDRGYIGNIVNERISLDESSLSRIWTHIRQDKRSFGIVSVFRSSQERQLSKTENSAVNEKNHLELKKVVRTLGYGYVELQGGFKSESGFNLEKSLFIPNIKKKELTDIGVKYDQFSVIYKDSNEFIEIGTNKVAGIGRTKNKFDFKDEKSLVLAKEVMKDFFSRLLKGSHRGQKFLFKLQEKEVASFNRVAYHTEPLQWITIYEDNK